MELKFKPERLQLFKRLSGVTYKDIIQGMNEMGKSERNLKHPVDRWAMGGCDPNEENLSLLCKSLHIPIGFFFYEKIDLRIYNEQGKYRVCIEVTETNESFFINLI